jgi:hypothetical protein
MKNKMFMMNISIYLEAIELAQKNGKKAGDSIEKELIEIIQIHKDEVTYLGETEKDKDLIVGNLRENGLKILNLDEIERQKKIKEEQNGKTE